ncbi:MAG: sugar transferase, partial [Thalassospira sp.]|nr:sugar transferase [Thalassospira sp.]
MIEQDSMIPTAVNNAALPVFQAPRLGAAWQLSPSSLVYVLTHTLFFVAFAVLLHGNTLAPLSFGFSPDSLSLNIPLQMAAILGVVAAVVTMWFERQFVIRGILTAAAAAIMGCAAALMLEVGLLGLLHADYISFSSLVQDWGLIAAAYPVFRGLRRLLLPSLAVAVPALVIAETAEKAQALARRSVAHRRFTLRFEGMLVADALPSRLLGNALAPYRRHVIFIDPALLHHDTGRKIQLFSPFVIAGLPRQCLPVLRAQYAVLRRLTVAALKRGFDVAASSMALLVFSPVLYYIYRRVARDGGSPIFGHSRIGKDGVSFQCLKFRSMVPNAQSILADYLANNIDARAEWDRDFKLKNDPRVTPFGAFLRKTSLDELPQLWNVLRGEMSLVGPRPIIYAELEKYGDAVDFY